MANATNYFKNVYDKIESLILADTNFARLKNGRRLFKRDKLLIKDVAHEDGIMLTPMTDEMIEPRTGGREDEFFINLVYFKKQNPEINYDELTQVAENLIDLFKDNRHPSTNEWHYITASYDIGIELPEDMEDKNYFGFTMALSAFKGKYA